jgi:hypothetical protein
VLFPKGEVNETKLPGAKPADVTAVMTQDTLPDEGGMYMVTYSDYPDQAVKDPDAVFKAARTGLVSVLGEGGKVSGESRITLDDNPGREFTIDLPEGKAHCRMYLVKNRLYQLAAAGDKVTDKDAKRFFDSFKLTGN